MYSLYVPARLLAPHWLLGDISVVEMLHSLTFVLNYL